MDSVVASQPRACMWWLIIVLIWSPLIAVSSGDSIYAPRSITTKGSMSSTVVSARRTRSTLSFASSHFHRSRKSRVVSPSTPTYFRAQSRSITLASNIGWEGDTNTDVARLVLLRHGQSTWNANPTFTGWCDPPLTDRGASEAISAGRLLEERGFPLFTHAFTSVLSRATVTCDLALEQHTADDKPQIEKAWQLNERHYGALQGFSKKDPDLIQKYGKEQIHKWRRDFRASPPAMDETHEHYTPPPAPLTESLLDCQKRVLSYWEDEILPTLIPGNTVLIAAHSNTMRALVAYLDETPTKKIPNIHIPNGVPCVYTFQDGVPISPMLETPAGGSRGMWLFSAENHKRLRGKIGGSESFTRSIFDAWDENGDGVLSRTEIEDGLRGIMGGDDIIIAAIAAKILEEVDADGNETLDLEEFEASALKACRKFAPELMEA